MLNSPKAIEMGIYVVRAFLRLREMLASNTELARQFAQLEARLDKKLANHDEAIAAILSAIRQLMNPIPSSWLKFGDRCSPRVVRQGRPNRHNITSGARNFG